MTNHTEIEYEYVELSIQPIPPDTVSSVKADLLPAIEAALREAGQEQLLSEGQIEVEVEQTFPTDAVIVVGLTFLSQVALATCKEIVLPGLKKRFDTKQKRKGKGKRKRKK